MPITELLERRIVTTDPERTRALAAHLAGVARPGDVLTLVGELGAGKTVFAKGFGRGLGVPGTINSPSFVLMAEYEGRLPLFHLDLYRLADAREAVAGGLLDERQSSGVTLIEWAERLGDVLPAARLEVALDGTGDDPRTITLRATTDAYRRYLDAAESAGEAVPGTADPPGAADPPGTADLPGTSGGSGTAERPDGAGASRAASGR